MRLILYSALGILPNFGAFRESDRKFYQSRLATYAVETVIAFALYGLAYGLAYGLGRGVSDLL